jgi:hypothetical protein
VRTTQEKAVDTVSPATLQVKQAEKKHNNAREPCPQVPSGPPGKFLYYKHLLSTILKSCNRRGKNELQKHSISFPVLFIISQSCLNRLSDVYTLEAFDVRGAVSSNVTVSVSTPASYLKGPEFEYQPRDQVFLQRFLVVLP